MTWNMMKQVIWLSPRVEINIIQLMSCELFKSNEKIKLKLFKEMMWL